MCVRQDVLTLGAARQILLHFRQQRRERAHEIVQMNVPDREGHGEAQATRFAHQRRCKQRNAQGRARPIGAENAIPEKAKKYVNVS